MASIAGASVCIFCMPPCRPEKVFCYHLLLEQIEQVLELLPGIGSMKSYSCRPLTWPARSDGRLSSCSLWRLAICSSIFRNISVCSGELAEMFSPPCSLLSPGSGC